MVNIVFITLPNSASLETLIYLAGYWSVWSEDWHNWLGFGPGWRRTARFQTTTAGATLETSNAPSCRGLEFGRRLRDCFQRSSRDRRGDARRCCSAARRIDCRKILTARRCSICRSGPTPTAAWSGLCRPADSRLLTAAAATGCRRCVLRRAGWCPRCRRTCQSRQRPPRRYRRPRRRLLSSVELSSRQEGSRTRQRDQILK